MLRLAGRALVRGGGSAPLSTSAARCLAAASHGEGQVDGVVRSFPEIIRMLFASTQLSRSSSSATAGPGSVSQADGGPDAAGAAAAAAADGGGAGVSGGSEGAAARAETEPASAGQEDEQDVAAALQEKTAQLTEAQKQIEEMDQKIEGLTSDLRYTLADMENLRKRMQVQMESTQKYAVQGFAKSMLDVADNLERAIGAVPPEEELASPAGGDTEAQEAKVRRHLTGLLEGVKMTERVLQQALQQHGVVKMEAQDQVFDPNLHNALFEVPDASRPAGTIATVAKTGYMLRDRVLRAADVGVAKSLE